MKPGDSLTLGAAVALLALVALAASYARASRPQPMERAPRGVDSQIALPLYPGLAESLGTLDHVHGVGIEVLRDAREYALLRRHRGIHCGRPGIAASPLPSVAALGSCARTIR